jgi:hypothetical protein
VSDLSLQGLAGEERVGGQHSSLARATHFLTRAVVSEVLLEGIPLLLLLGHVSE